MRCHWFIRRCWPVVFVLAGCGSSTPTKTISLAALVGLTGSIGNTAALDAIQLATADMNAGLKTANQALQFSIPVDDSQNDATGAIAVQRVTDRVKNGGAKGVIVDVSSDDVALLKLAYDSDASNDLKVPLVCYTCTSVNTNNPNATNPDMTTQLAYQDAQGWNYRTNSSSANLVASLMNIVKQRATGATYNIVLYAPSGPFGNGFNAALRAAAAKLTTATVTVNTLFHDPNADLNSYDWTGDMAKVAAGSWPADAFNPTAVNAGPPDLYINSDFVAFAVGMTKAYLIGAYTIPTLSVISLRMSDADLAIAFSNPSQLNGQEGIGWVPYTGTSGAIYATELENAKRGATASQFPGYAYDATAELMLATLIASHGMADPTQVTGPQIRDAMAKINDPNGTVIPPGPANFAMAAQRIAQGLPINYDGATGPQDFDATRNPISNFSRFKIQSGHVSDVEIFDCISDATCPSRTP